MQQKIIQTVRINYIKPKKLSDISRKVSPMMDCVLQFTVYSDANELQNKIEPIGYSTIVRAFLCGLDFDAGHPLFNLLL